MIEDDPRFAGHPARPRARAGLPVCRRPRTARRRPAGRRHLPAERDPARREPARPFRPGRARPAQAQPTTRHIPVHMTSVADYTPGGARPGRRRLRAQAGQARGTGRGVRRARGTLQRRTCAACSWWRTTRASARASASCWTNADVRDHRRGERGRRARAQLQATTFDCMVMDLNLPDLQRLRAARAAWPSRTTWRSRP